MTAAAKERTIRKVGIADAISEAFSEFDSLAQEMRDWADSLEEKFSTTAKYETVSSTADTLEGLSEPNMPDGLPAIEIEFSELPQRKRGYSRADRCGQACYILQECCDALDAAIEEHEKDEADEPRDSLEALRDEIENAKCDAEGLEFPGMYG